MAKKKSMKPSIELPPSAVEQIERAFPGGFSARDEANCIVAFAIRNGSLEDLHAGERSELLKRKNLSRITDAEMKRLILFACEKIECLLRMKEEPPGKLSHVRHDEWGFLLPAMDELAAAGQWTVTLKSNYRIER